MWNPLTQARYKIEIDKLGELAFTEMSGLKDSTEVVDYQEGGVNDHVHRFIGNTKVDNLTFKHGTGPGTKALWDLRKSVVFSESPETFSGAVVLLDDEGNEVHRWPFENAFIVKWEGPPLKGDGGTLSIETLELATNVKRSVIKPPPPPQPKKKTPPPEPTPPPRKPPPAPPEEKGKPPADDERITSDFVPKVEECLEGETIEFKDQSKIVGGTISKWEWRCPSNQGWTSSEQHPKARFDRQGSHKVVLTVTSATGKKDDSSRIVKVMADTIRADFVPRNAIVPKGDSVKFTDKSVSKSPISKWEWSCPGEKGWKASEQHPSCTFETVGEHEVTLTVTSTTEKKDSIAFPVKVVPDCPDWPVQFTYAQSEDARTPLKYTFELPTHGPNGENLAFIDWDFDPRLEKLNTRWRHQQRKPVVSFPESKRTYTIKCGVRLQGHVDCWYLMKLVFEPGKDKKGKSTKAIVKPYVKPKGTLKFEIPID